MDFALISTAVGSLKAAKDLGQAALGIRDFNQFASTISQINDQLLKAQESLFTHNAQLMQLQQDHFEARDELRKLRDAATERGRYTLFELSEGVFVYRAQESDVSRTTSDSSAGTPLHYLCQPCFDTGFKVVLQKHVFYTLVSLECSKCNSKYSTGKHEN